MGHLQQARPEHPRQLFRELAGFILPDFDGRPSGNSGARHRKYEENGRWLYAEPPIRRPSRELQTSDFRLRVHGNVAFITGNSLDSNTNEHSQDFLVLEKTGVAWKILALTAQYYETGKRVEVN